MKCSARSTTWPGNVIVLTLLLTVLTADAAPAAACVADEAMRAAIRAAVGPDATVALSTLSCELAEGAVVDSAVPEPGGRAGKPVRFRLLQGGRQAGYAISVPEVSLRHVRAARPLAAGSVVAGDDVREEVRAIDGELIGRLPAAAEVVGHTTLRAVARDEVITARTVRVPPAVRSGDRVVIRAIVLGVEARGVATAQQSGAIGDVIRLVNPETRRQLKGRIVGKNEVEVLHGS